MLSSDEEREGVDDNGTIVVVVDGDMAAASVHHSACWVGAHAENGRQLGRGPGCLGASWCGNGDTLGELGMRVEDALPLFQAVCLARQAEAIPRNIWEKLLVSPVFPALSCPGPAAVAPFPHVCVPANISTTTSEHFDGFLFFFLSFSVQSCFTRASTRFTCSSVLPVYWQNSAFLLGLVGKCCLCTVVETNCSLH